MREIVPEILAEDDWEINWASDRLQNYCKQHSSRLTQFDIERINNLQNKLKSYEFEIAVLGISSCGKTALINAIQGKKKWLISPKHDTTADFQSLDLYQAPKVQIKLIDTSGLDEVTGELRAEMAMKVAQQADLILFVTAGDITRLELEVISQLKQTYKPILLVFNKFDLYPQSDRQLIHAALQDQDLQNLISPEEIIFTAANPLPRRIRREFNNSSEEAWESLIPDVKALKQKILDILNHDGRGLLAINTMRSLLAIHRDLIQTQLEKFIAKRTIASGVFIVKAIAIIITPISALDFGLSILIDTSLMVGAIGLLGYIRLGQGMVFSVINAMVLISIPNQFAQIAWLGVATPWLLEWLWQDLQKPHALNQFIKKLQMNYPQDSMLQRLKFKF